MRYSMVVGGLGVTVVWASGLLAGCGESSEWDPDEPPQPVACVEQCERIEAGLPWCFGEGWSLGCERACQDGRFAAFVELCEECREMYGVRSLCDDEVCPECRRVIWD